ncbi:basic proline-rich protein-like [Eumetopias jubatus]|uniref:basic proline-rich protein-like n=1 Tax=Eumetopias jubatus TaxID=34886 RepID=UPI001016081E|nr:basic proline-rich protein-like [Eumetopias jubatus]
MAERGGRLPGSRHFQIKGIKERFWDCVWSREGSRGTDKLGDLPKATQLEPTPADSGRPGFGTTLPTSRARPAGARTVHAQPPAQQPACRGPRPPPWAGPAEGRGRGGSRPGPRGRGGLPAQRRALPKGLRSPEQERRGHPPPGPPRGAPSPAAVLPPPGPALRAAAEAVRASPTRPAACAPRRHWLPWGRGRNWPPPGRGPHPG